MGRLGAVPGLMVTNRLSGPALLLLAACSDASLDNFVPRVRGAAGGLGGASMVATVSSSTTSEGVDELLIDDFEDGDTLASNGFGWWYTQNDTAGDQDFRISATTDRASSSAAANTSGIGFDVWGALIGLDLTLGEGVYDATAFTELAFWAKTAPDGVSLLSARLIEGGALQFEKPIELSTTWQQFSLRFEELSAVDGSERQLDSSQLIALQVFVFSGERFDFWIDDVVLR